MDKAKYGRFGTVAFTQRSRADHRHESILAGHLSEKLFLRIRIATSVVHSRFASYFLSICLALLCMMSVQTMCLTRMVAGHFHIGLVVCNAFVSACCP
jgi:hypothetical protein